MSANELQSRTAGATTGTQITNVAAAFLTATAPEQVYVKAIVLENTTVGTAPCTCQITDGDPSGTYNLLVSANSCIVPYVAAADYELKSLTITFDIPYRIKHGALWGLAGAANGIKAIVYTVQ